MRVRFTFNDQSMDATLYDNPSARDFYSTLPLDLTIDNYAQNEKVVYLPRKLTEEAAGPFDNEQAGDLCYFAPWGEFGPLLRQLSLVEWAYPPRAFRGWA